MPNGSPPDETSNSTIWLEVANVRTQNGSVQIQVKGDRTDHEPVWWHVGPKAHDDVNDVSKVYRAVCEGLDKKRIVIAGLASNGTEIECNAIRIQYADSPTR